MKRAVVSIVAVIIVCSAIGFYLLGERQIVLRGKGGVMGTYAEVVVVALAREEGRAKSAIECAFDEMQRISSLFSRYDSTSPLSVLNSQCNVSKNYMDSSKYGENGWDEFVWILEQSKIIHDLTGGAFDITVKPLLDLYSGDKPPSDDTINETLELVNIENLTIDDDHVEIKNEMSITLDGIAKGYGVDKASEILTEEGFEDHLVNIGGEVRCSGLDKGGKWVVGIADPSDPEKAYRKIHVSDISIATSGNYLQRHIIDPRNGSVVESNVKSVTVLGENCTWCDGLATAIFVLGANGLELINSKDLEELECLIITDSGCIASRGFEGIVG